MSPDPSGPSRASAAVAPATAGSRRFERALVTLVSVFGFLFALQTVDSLAADWSVLAGALRAVVTALEIASVLVGASAALLGARARAAFLLAFLLHVVALLLWPLAIHGPASADETPWLVAVWGTQAAYLSAAARRWPVPIIGGVLVATDVTTVLVTAGGQSWGEALQNGLFCLAISGILTAVITGVRRAVAVADAAQHAALQRYAASRIDEAVEAERVRTDALVHDAVLTTFLSASNASDPASEALVVRMAQRALRVTSAATLSAEEGRRVCFPDALQRIRPAFVALSRHFAELRLEATQDLFLPEPVAQAVVAAMLEAMADSVQHTGDGIRRSVVSAVGAGDGVRIEVRRVGRGAEPDAGPVLPTSILEGMRGAGGDAELTVLRGAGTAIVLTYPAVTVASVQPADPSLVLA